MMVVPVLDYVDCHFEPETFDAVLAVLDSPSLRVTSKLVVLQHLVQYDPRWSYEVTTKFLPGLDAIIEHAPQLGIQFLFFAYHKVRSIFILLFFCL